MELFFIHWQLVLQLLEVRGSSLKKKQILYLSILIICILLSACQLTKHNHSANSAGNDAKKRIDFEDFNNGKNNLNYLSFRENDSVIYLYAENGNVTCYRYYFNDGKNVKIAELQDLDGYSSTVAELNEDIYFIVAKRCEDGEIKNELVSISLSNNTLKVLSDCDDKSLPGLEVYLWQNQIVTLKNIVNSDKSIVTLLDGYDLNHDRWETGEKCLWKSYQEEGAALYAFYSDGDKLYAIKDEYAEEGLKRRLISYGPSYEELFSIPFTGDFLDYSNSGRIIQLFVDDDLIYIRNTSNYGCAARITDGTFETVRENQKNLTKAWISSRQGEKEDVFYIRRSNVLLLWDPNRKAFKEICLDLDEGESIHVAMIDGNSLFLSCYVQDSQGNPLGKHVYLIMDYLDYLSKL